MRWYIGTSGWSYNAWEGFFYPEKLPPTDRLEFYSSSFDAVEINNTFYHMPSREQMLRWEEKVPQRFTFAVKASRYITHIKRLKDAKETVPRMMEVLSVERKGGPIIFQLPPRFKPDLERLGHFLKTLPKERRCAIEFRDPAWHCEEVYMQLEKRNVAFCLFEKGELRSPRLATADFIYVRLHGRKEHYKGNYSKQALRDWCDWLTDQGRSAYVFFDNTDEKLHAVENALELKMLASF